MKSILLLLVFSTFSLFIFAQEDIKHCGADEMRITTLQQLPDVAKAIIKRDEALENFTKKFVSDFYNKNVSTAIYTIPVVFHVIHNYGFENISDAQILDGLDILNKTFRKQLSDTASIVADFKPLHADCDIEFKLAQLDPDGNCTKGINRIASPLTAIGDHSVKSLIHWPPNKYLNIYIVANAAGLAGHCVWPSDADTIPLWDGIVVGYNYIGSIGASNYTTSVALAHECGHYLNLQHIWGGNNVPNFYYYPCADPNKDCNIDDLVSDTPPTIGWQTCNLSGASCGNTVDNVQNTMDYSYCNRMFTYGQKARMQACLNDTIAHRNNLWQTSNLIATGVLNYTPTVCAASFTSNKTVICKAVPNNTVVFTNTSFTDTTASVEWSFPGGSPATSAIKNPTVTYTTAGKYDVILKAFNATDTAVITKINYITVLPTTGGTAYPFAEGFETLTGFDGPDWFKNSMDTINKWALTTTASYSGSKSVMLANFNNQESTKDELYSPIISLNGASAMNISFKYAFAQKDTSNTDKLQLYISNGCGSSWLQRLSLTGAALATVAPTTSAFTPTAANEWKQGSATILSSYLSSGFRFKFVFSSNGGNNLFIDDINIDVHAGVNELDEMISMFQLFPNPSNGEVNLSFELLEQMPLDISISNVLGQSVYKKDAELYTQGAHQLALNLKDIPNGIYMVKLSDGVRSVSKKMVVGGN